MDGQAVDKIIKALEPLASKIGEGAQFMYSVYYRQTIIEGIISTVACVAMLIATPFIIKGILWLFKKAIEEDSKPGGDGVGYGGSAIVGVIVSVVAFMFAVCSLPEGILKLANPHFYTIERIVNSVQDKEVK